MNIKLEHIYRCCGKGFDKARKLKTALEHAGHIVILTSQRGHNRMDICNKFSLDTKTKDAFIIIDNDICVNTRDVSDEYIAKTVIALKGNTGNTGGINEKKEILAGQNQATEIPKKDN